MTKGPEGIERLTHWLYRYRGETAAPFAVLLLVLARPTWGRLGVGLTLIAAGECLRLWAASHIGSHARGRTFHAPTGEALARSGPYQLMSHPLYAGNLLVCLGLLVAARAGEPWFPALFLVVFCGQYTLFIRHEDTLRRQASPVPAPHTAPGTKSTTPTTQPASPGSLAPAMTRAGLALEWPTLRTVLALGLFLVGLTWWWSAR